MKFYIETLGCKVNSYESEAVLNDLINHGWEYSKDDDVDVVDVDDLDIYLFIFIF